MSTKSIRLNSELIFQAKSVGHIQNRSAPNQIEYWANLGKIISSVIGMEDALAVVQGLKKLRVEPEQSTHVDSDAVFSSLEDDRAKGFVDKPITSAPFYFEASQKSPGLLDKVDSHTGERKTGKFESGTFTEINV